MIFRNEDDMQGEPTAGELTKDEQEEDEDDDDNEQGGDFRARLWTRYHVQCFGVPSCSSNFHFYLSLFSSLAEAYST